MEIENYVSEDLMLVWKWSQQSTLQLIELIKINYEKILTGVKKKVYNEISEELRTKYNLNVTGQQVESKWKTLKRGYKKGRLNINRSRASGEKRKVFAYYDAVDEILNGTQADPLATLSTDDECPKLNGEDFAESIEEKPTSTLRLNTTNSYKRGKRTYSEANRYEPDDREAAIAERHKERMELSKRFLQIFERMVDKM